MDMSQNVLNPRGNLLRHDLELTGNTAGENCRETDGSGGIPALGNHSSTRGGGMEQLGVSKGELVINKRETAILVKRVILVGKYYFFYRTPEIWKPFLNFLFKEE